MKLGRLLEGLNEKQVFGNQDLEILGLAYDSRKARPGSLFIAIKGYRLDGQSFIPEAISRGAVAVVLKDDIRVEEGVSKIVVPDSRKALSVLANEFYDCPSRKLGVIGITGTDGKTTTAYLTEAVLGQAGFKVGLLGTIEYRMGGSPQPAQITTPESLDLQTMLASAVQANFDYVVMEVSSHSLALHRVDEIEFDVGVFTNLSPEHLDFHERFSDYLQAKTRLFLQLGEGVGPSPLARDTSLRRGILPLWGSRPETPDGVEGNEVKGKVGQPPKASLAMGGKVALINADDRYSQYIMAHTKAEVLTYGIKPGADVRARNVRSTLKGISFRLQSPAGQADIRLNLIGDYNVYNALAAVGVGLSQGVGLEQIEEGLGSISTVPGRFEPIDEGQDFQVMVDYAHTEGALEGVLKAARGLTPGRIISVFGCGGDRDRSKRSRMGQISGRYSDYTILTSDNPRSEEPLDIISQIEIGLKRSGGNYRVIQDRYQAISQALDLARVGDTVIIAGKGHESFQIFKDKTIPFDDRQVARKILKEKA